MHIDLGRLHIGLDFGGIGGFWLHIGLDFGCIRGPRAVELACGLGAELNGCSIKMVKVCQQHPGQRVPSAQTVGASCVLGD